MSRTKTRFMVGPRELQSVALGGHNSSEERAEQSRAASRCDDAGLFFFFFFFFRLFSSSYFSCLPMRPVSIFSFSNSHGMQKEKEKRESNKLRGAAKVERIEEKKEKKFFSSFFFL
eukprot:TRINITY_DN5811_c0_g1_i6.p5 TRINITY_DN5811_c0_g1~~TRINITY_DN5811_c0_g1_i6.p5  ORF type:complete len:116 (-),score=50.86 TRINITY_DN5811_c0_g1_i6:69-416(-)